MSDVTLRCGKCGRKMSNCSVDHHNPARSAGICPEHGVMYASKEEYQ